MSGRMGVQVAFEQNLWHGKASNGSAKRGGGAEVGPEGPPLEVRGSTFFGVFGPFRASWGFPKFSEPSGDFGDFLRPLETPGNSWRLLEHSRAMGRHCWCA